MTCARAGYSLETRCHLGRVIEFDTQSRFGWRGDIRHHPLSVMINKVLGAGGLWPDPHNPGNDTGSTWVTVPDAREQLDCQVGPSFRSVTQMSHAVAGLLQVDV